MHEPKLGKPEVSGPYGKAWVIANPGAALKGWIVHAPQYHPVWHSYLISVIHLRPILGLPEAIKYDERATHEVMVYALDPNKDIDPEHLHYLTPPNYMEQFASTSDADAVIHVLSAVIGICSGALSPDTDFKADWLKRFPFQNPGRRPRHVVGDKLAAADGMNRRH